MPEKTEFQSAFDLGAASIEIREVFGTPVAIVPESYDLMDLERLLPAPLRIKASPKFATAESFADYVKEFQTAGSRLFADPKANQIVAILDYHQPGTPQWGSHTATLCLRIAEEWKTWTGNDKRALSQVEFARFLKTNAQDIVEPDGAFIAEVVRHFMAKRTVVYESGVSLSDGTMQLEYRETQESKGKGAVRVPEEFTLGIPYYFGEKGVALNADLSHDINDETKCLTFTYRLDHPDRIADAAFENVRKAIADATGLPVLLGTP